MVYVILHLNILVSWTFWFIQWLDSNFAVHILICYKCKQTCTLTLSQWVQKKLFMFIYKKNVNIKTFN